MSDAPIRLLALDSYGTLFDVKSALEQTMLPLGLAPRLATKWIYQMQSEAARRTAPDTFIPFPQLVAESLDQVIASAQLQLREEQTAKLLAAWRRIPAFPEVRSALEQWNDLCASPWIVTNGDAGEVSGLLDQNQLSSLVEGVVTAEDVQAYKPAPALYERVCSITGARPAQTALISALPGDVVGGQKIGIRVAYVDRGSRPYPGPGAPDWTVHSVAAAVEALQQLLPRPDASVRTW